MNRSSVFGLIAALLFACGGSTASTNGEGTTVVADTVDPAATYPIQIDRPEAVGRRWAETTEAHEVESQNVFMGEDTDERGRDIRVKIEANVEVTALDAHGRQAALRYEVTQAIANNGTADLELVPAGTILNVTRGDEGTITRADGVEIGPVELKMLSLVIPDGPADDHDAVFGNPEPQAIGARWPIDATAAARQLERRRLQIDPTRLEGEMHVASRVEEPVPALEVTAQIVAQGIQFPDTPEGATVTRGDVVVARVAYLPLDLSQHPIVQSSEMEMEVDMSLTDPDSGEAGRLEIRINLSRSSIQLPL